MAKRSKFELLVESVSISSRQDPSPQTLQFRMIDDLLHQPLAQTLPAIFAYYENIADVSKRRLIAHHSGKSDLLIADIQPEADRILDRGLRLFERAFTRPI